MLQNTYLIGIPQNHQDHEKQAMTEQLSSTRGNQGDMTTKCNIASWIGS